MRQIPQFIFGLAVITVAGLTPAVSAAQDHAQIEVGRKVYDKYCVVCHGVQGDGKGLMGVIHRAQKNGMVVSIYPRDFTAGMFKFRSTETGSLPMDEDLLNTVTNGIPRSGMPSHKDVSLDDRKAVIEYVKTFSGKWDEADPPVAIPIGKAPSYVRTAESAGRGKKLYNEYGCFQCHGELGRGDGPASPNLQDNWGEPILAFDFSSGPLKGGTEPEDIYKTFVTGLDGTPMPSFADSLTEKQRWDIVSYCLVLMEN